MKNVTTRRNAIFELRLEDYFYFHHKEDHFFQEDHEVPEKTEELDLECHHQQEPRSEDTHHDYNGHSNKTIVTSSNDHVTSNNKQNSHKPLVQCCIVGYQPAPINSPK